MVIHPATSDITWANRWDHFLARVGVRRTGGHLARPGLYALGRPTPDSPVFVTANYTLSFDAVRSALAGRDAYILVLNTRGINVWCAAGKGTFGDGEIATRVRATRLGEVVSHRTLILPQLGAAGVSAEEVKRRTGFAVRYGPVRAADLPEYLRTGKATSAMRRVRFTLADRLVLIPIELVHAALPTVAVAAALWLVGARLAAWAVVAAVLAGTALFPALLPWLPTREFSPKGFILGGAVVAPFAVAAVSGSGAGTAGMVGGGALWLRLLSTLAYLLTLPPVTAFLALNFTGATTFTSRTGVKREIATYIPVMAWLAGTGLVAAVATVLARLALRAG
jgi:hypothetical protein